MSEAQTNSPEVREGKEYEAQLLVYLNELVTEMYVVAHENGPSGVSDGSIDLIGDYCEALARRDPEMGSLLETKLEQRAPLREEVAPAEAESHYGLASRIRGALQPPTPAPPSAE